MSVPRIDVNFADDAPEVELNVREIAITAIAAANEYLDMELHEQAELSVLVCGDETIRGLNHQWREKDKPTNVLSFPNEPDGVLLGNERTLVGLSFSR
ncbi:MAG: rRNA maturation RNase YbeY, partial [Rhizobiaceae bacterium]|nr:rRNA maturation RNase YbeY [Rhizobiaceae bacterium]